MEDGEHLASAGPLGGGISPWKDDNAGSASPSPSPSSSPLRSPVLDVAAAAYTSPAKPCASVATGSMASFLGSEGLSGKKRADGGGEFSTGEKRRRGRPPGTGRRQLLAVLGEWFAQSAGGNFTPHVVTVPTGEDVAAKILSLAQKGPRAICILSANGSISNVTLRQPGSSGGTLTYELTGTDAQPKKDLFPQSITSSLEIVTQGRFEIISLSGSFATTTADSGVRSRTGGMSVSLGGPDGRMVGGGVAGSLLAASPIQIVVGSFMPNITKQQPQDKPKPPISSSPGVAARPLSQVNPELDDSEAPSSGLSGERAGTSPDPSFSPPVVVSWHALQSSAEPRVSPDMNVRLAPGV